MTIQGWSGGTRVIKGVEYPVVTRPEFLSTGTDDACVAHWCDRWAVFLRTKRLRPGKYEDATFIRNRADHYQGDMDMIDVAYLDNLALDRGGCFRADPREASHEETQRILGAICAELASTCK